VRKGSLALAVVCAAVFAVVAVANAQRKPSLKEHAQIAAVVDLPVNCSRVRVSTETKKPKWGSVSWRNGGPTLCRSQPGDNPGAYFGGRLAA
jgi:hypothetical protein